VSRLDRRGCPPLPKKGKSVAFPAAGIVWQVLHCIGIYCIILSERSGGCLPLSISLPPACECLPTIATCPPLVLWGGFVQKWISLPFLGHSLNPCGYSTFSQTRMSHRDGVALRPECVSATSRVCCQSRRCGNAATNLKVVRSCRLILRPCGS
jgi:hypothetical protein